MKKLEALFDAVIVKPIENEETLYGNIIVPDMGKEKNEYGEVIAVGFGRYTLTGVMIPMTLKLPFDGEEYYVGPENQVLAKVQQTIEGVLTETELTEDDKTNLTDI